MSRVGKYPVIVPQGVEVAIDGARIRAKGKLGELSMAFGKDVTVTREGDKIVVQPASDTKRARMMWGTTRALVGGMVRGVGQGYQTDLEISGVGYRAQVQGKSLQLQIGLSHDVSLPIPEGLTVTVEKNTQVSVKGADKAKLGQFCAVIRSLKPPEPYKGKGIKYKGEKILRKEGKKK
jgi:large subunit ribosomal protein L6